MFCDTHCHLIDKSFDDEREHIISSFKKNEVAFVIENGTCAEDSMLAEKLADENDSVYFAAGIHPEFADSFSIDSESVIEELLSHDKAVAVGEVGLDYHYDISSRDMQIQVFERMLALAERTCKPVIVHSRDANKDTFDIIKQTKARCVLHCYSGSSEMAEQYTELGCFFGFGGAITFSGAKKNVRNVSVIPLERIFTETDCPYMTPVPFRGKLNQPCYIKYVIDKIAEIKNTDISHVENVTMNNAVNFFGIRSFFK